MTFLSEVRAKFRDIFARPDCSEEWREGNNAYYDGVGQDACPYTEESKRHHEWMAGYYGH